MTTQLIVEFFDAHPFRPFTAMLADGREVHVMHPEQISIGEHALTVTFIHPTRQIEVIDSALIVSLRTVYPAEHEMNF